MSLLADARLTAIDHDPNHVLSSNKSSSNEQEHRLT